MESKDLMDKRYSNLLLVSIIAAAAMIISGCSFAKEEIPVEIKPELNQMETPPQDEELEEQPTPTIEEAEVTEMSEKVNADVISVKVSGTADQFQFTVEISSPDTGCQQYTDWWEVITEDGTLLYRRILLHSHVNEQPFSRSGGAVKIGQNTVVIVRAHMNPGGYGGMAMKGSPQDGFREITLESNFAIELEMEPPLPTGCDF